MPVGVQRTALPADSTSDAATQPAGVGTLIPSPLSSQTSSSGNGTPRWAIWAAALIEPWAVEWFSEASPKLHTARASVGHWVSTSSSSAAPMAKATPSALGSCEAIVEVCGITARSALPNTLWRPPAIGSSAAASSPLRMSPTPSWEADLLGPRQVESRPSDSASSAGSVGTQGGGHEGVGLMAGRPDRVEAASLGTQPARRVVEVAAGDLGVEQHVETAPRQRRARRHRRVRYGARPSRSSIAATASTSSASDSSSRWRSSMPLMRCPLMEQTLQSRSISEQVRRSHDSVSENGATNMTMTGIADDLTADSTAPDLRTELPGPNASAIIARDEAVTSPSLTRVYPLVVQARPRVRHRGCRRQPLLGLQRRDRRRRRRPRPSRRQRGDPRPGRRRPALLLERLLPARLRRRQRAPRPAGPDDRRHQDVPVELRHGGRRGGAQARPPSHRTTQRHRLPRRLPRPLARQPVVDGQQVPPARRVRRPDAGELPRPVLGPARRGRR